MPVWGHVAKLLNRGTGVVQQDRARADDGKEQHSAKRLSCPPGMVPEHDCVAVLRLDVIVQPSGEERRRG